MIARIDEAGDAAAAIARPRRRARHRRRCGDAARRVPRDRPRAALGTLPTQATIVLERFFDESGGMQLVIHSPFGSRINRAWGLALRKRFCVKFNFELQAAATEDAIVLSLSTSHSFELAAVARYLHSNTVRDVLIQAMLDAPMFAARWRWIAGTALALPRFRGGKKVPAPLQRMRADDLMAAVFPDQIACAENLAGDREIPDHPLVRQTVHDCLYEAMDIEGLERLLRGIESGRDRDRRARPRVAVAARARDPDRAAVRVSRRRAARGAPHAGGDGAALARRGIGGDARRSSIVAAIDRVRAEAWPEARKRRRDARRAARARVRHAGRGRAQRRVAGATSTSSRGSGARRACAISAIARAGAHEPAARSGSRPNGCRNCKPSVRSTSTLAPPIEAPDEFARRAWTRDAALSRSCARGSRDWDRSPANRSPPRCACRSTRSTRRWPRSAAQGVAMAGVVHADRDRRRNGAIARCSRASIATRSSACARRSSPSARRTSCASCSAGSICVPNDRREGPDALDAVISQLQGFEAPVAAWEIGAPARASRRLRHDVARRSVPVGPRRVDAPDAAGRQHRPPATQDPIRTTPVDAAAAPRRGRSGIASRRRRRTRRSS